MTNKKAPINYEDNIKPTTIIPYNSLKINLLDNMPPVLGDIIKTLSKEHINISTNCITNIVLAKTVQMFSFKRIMLREVENLLILNWYAIVFMASGYGKDRLIKTLNKTIFKLFRIYTKDKLKDYRIGKIEQIKQEALGKISNDNKREAYIEEQIRCLRNLVMEVEDGTQEGFHADAKAFDEAKLGALFVIISELGLYLLSSTTDKKKFLDCLFKAYDGIVSSKSIKGGTREESIENAFVNCLLYSDYTLFKGELKNMLSTLLHTGLGRRAVITFLTDKKLKNDVFTSAEHSQIHYDLMHHGEILFSIFSQVEFDTEFILSQEAKDNVLNPYKTFLNNEFNNCDNDLLKKEIKSRELKALKLSCLYACLNHPQVNVIYENDVEQAIHTIQALSVDLKAFDNYKPVKKDKYDGLYSFFVENIGKGFSKMELIDNSRQFGFSRDKFRKEFAEIIEFIREIALGDNYILFEKPINNNTGREYSLCITNNGSDNVKSIGLNELIKG